MPNKLCRSQLASIISAQRLRKCQGFIDKVGEIRFTKVKQRQLNKFNNLLNKKEGNITRANSLNSQNLASQAGRKAGTLLPPGEGSNLVAQATQSGKQAGAHLPLGEGGYLSQAGSQASQASQASQVVSSQPGAHLPPGEGSISMAQAGTHLPNGEGSNIS